MTPKGKAESEAAKPKTKMVWLLEFEGDIPAGGKGDRWWVCHACEGPQKHRLRRVTMNADEPSDSTHISKKRGDLV